MDRPFVQQRIAAPQAAVFEMFADFRHVAGRIRGIKRVEVLTAGPTRAGTRFRETREMFGREATEEMEVAAFDPPHGYRVSCVSYGSELAFTFRFVPDGEGTRVTVDYESRPLTLTARLFSPLSWLMIGAVRNCLQDDITDLQRHLEAPATAPP